VAATKENRKWRLRKWLDRLEGRTLRGARFDKEDTLDLVFDGGARLTAFYDPDEPRDLSLWQTKRHPHPIAWTDYTDAWTGSRYRGAE